MTVESTSAEDLRMDVAALFGALWSRAVRIVIVTILLVVATFVVLMFVPKQYESVASLLVEDRTSSFTQAAAVQPATGAGITIDALMSSQIELIKSRDTLLAVVDTLKLRDVAEFNGSAGNPLTSLLTLVGRKPEPKNIDEAVLQSLNDRLTVIRERDSAVISIYVRSADPQLAANIANAIAAEHVKRRAQQSVADTAEATAWLQQQIEQLRVKVQEADSKVAYYKSKKGIFAGVNGTTLPDQQISDIGKQITDAQAARNVAAQHAALIRSLLKSGQSVDGVDDVRNSAVIQSLMQNRATLQSTLAEKLATLLPGHPTIKALNAQIKQLNTQIAAEALRVADGLDGQVTVQDGIIKSLNADLTTAQQGASAQTKDGVTLDSLTREAKAQRDLLDAYLLKYRDASGRTDSGSVLPDVRVVTQAAPSVVPASPKTGLLLGAVGFIALVLQVGMVLFGELMSGRAVYDRSQQRAEPSLEHDSDVEVEEQQVASRPGPDLADVREAMYAAGAAPAKSALAEEPEGDLDDGAQEDLVVEPYRGTDIDDGAGFSNLTADIALGRARVVLLAGIDDARDAAIVADMLVADTLHHGISVCRIDAGSMRVSSAPGLTDLCADRASYGDIVHKVREGLAEVPWGETAALDRRSTKPLTLLEALSDIYEVVIVATGRVGLNSTLPAFAGAHGRLVMVHRAATPHALVDAVVADAGALGFDRTEAILLPHPEAAVA